jgi:hypothetical protein
MSSANHTSTYTVSKHLYLITSGRMTLKYLLRLLANLKPRGTNGSR